MRTKPAQSGFTLVELAIVLVIIGLIIGGVLVGQDLIKAATIRSVVTDIEKINAGATTFRGKYNGLPGDLLNTRATEFGLNTAATDGNRDGTAGRGNGDNVIEGCASAGNGFGCENALFWADLSRAAMIPGAFNTYTTTLATVAVNTMGTYVPKTKLRDAALLSVFNLSGRNYLALGRQNNAAIAAVGAAGAITYDADTTTAAVTPLEARGIDEKIDDGTPLTGTVLAIATGTNPTTTNAGNAAPAANRCVNGTTATASYTSTTDAFLNNLACAISIRTSF
ncbi:MAG: prepilin-type N-terminal cleavage/methylation domain-containing protein [Rickettsiales bacterium]